MFLMPHENVFTYAKYFIYRSNNASPNLLKKSGNYGKLTNLKLNKLLYYLQGYHIGFFGKPLFKNRIEAWVHGPVVVEVYNAYKSFGFNKIEQNIDISEFQSMDPQVKELLDDIWEALAKYDGKLLENATHNESPWLNARLEVEDHEICDNEITKELLADYFVEIAKK